MTVYVRGQSVRLSDMNILVERSSGIYELSFDFDAAWDGWSASAVFRHAIDDAYTVVIEDGKAAIPPEVLVNGTLRIGVVGTNGTKVMPTLWAAPVTVKVGADTAALTPATPVQTLYAQLLEMIRTAASAISEHVADAVRHITAAERSAWDGKQDAIADLDSIREGAALGETAMQEVPETYRTAAAQDEIDSGKQDTLIAGDRVIIDEDGTISACDPILICDTTTTEVIQQFSLTEFNGRPIKDYHRHYLALGIYIPMDSTQTAANGNVWINPTDTTIYSSVARYIMSFSAWKTNNRDFAIHISALRGCVSVYDAGSAILSKDETIDCVQGIFLYIQPTVGHFPVGTRIVAYMI